jgi:sec-independent protein translocase protein TatB
MFDIGWSEMLVIVVVLIVVVGPKDLPKVMRMAGQWAAKARRMAAEFQNSLQELAHEAELDDVQREIKNLANTDVNKILHETVDPEGKLAEDMKVELPDLNATSSPNPSNPDPENPTALMEEVAKSQAEAAKPAKVPEATDAADHAAADQTEKSSGA